MVTVIAQSSLRLLYECREASDVMGRVSQDSKVPFRSQPYPSAHFPRFPILSPTLTNRLNSPLRKMLTSIHFAPSPPSVVDAVQRDTQMSQLMVLRMVYKIKFDPGSTSVDKLRNLEG